MRKQNCADICFSLYLIMQTGHIFVFPSVPRPVLLFDMFLIFKLSLDGTVSFTVFACE